MSDHNSVPLWDGVGLVFLWSRMASQPIPLLASVAVPFRNTGDLVRQRVCSWMLQLEERLQPCDSVSVSCDSRRRAGDSRHCCSQSSVSFAWDFLFSSEHKITKASAS